MLNYWRYIYAFILCFILLWLFDWQKCAIFFFRFCIDCQKDIYLVDNCKKNFWLVNVSFWSHFQFTFSETLNTIHGSLQLDSIKKVKEMVFLNCIFLFQKPYSLIPWRLSTPSWVLPRSSLKCWIPCIHRWTQSLKK